MKILLIGKNGQVGWELQRSLSTLGDVVAVDYFDKELCGDLTNLEGIAQTVRTVRPDVVVNAAAHTAVDKAESERELSDLLNDKGVAVLAAESAKLGALMVHYSTDYVFDVKVACLEEIGYRNKWLSAEGVAAQAERLKKTEYGAYLKRLLSED